MANDPFANRDIEGFTDAALEAVDANTALPAPIRDRARDELIRRATAGRTPPTIVRATIVDVDMPFWDMVFLMLKWSLASIPALIILGILGVLAGVAFASVLSGFRRA